MPPSPTTADRGRAAILISATHSGAGKTTVTGVMMAALRRRGLSVQPFKIGPDFIDAAHHAEVCGRPSINLDTWLQGEHGARRSFERWSADADIAVIEAMGGLFDGVDGTGRGSPAELAKLLGVPVVVVLDVWGMTRTAAPILRGLRDFDPEVSIAGCVLNRVGSAGHAAMVVDSLPDDVRALVVGSVAASEDLAIPERHLGIVTVQELGASAADRAEAREGAASDLDLDRIVEIAATMEHERATTSDEPESRAPASARPPAPATLTSDAPHPPPAAERLRMAIGQDEAFHFYYEENLELLRRAGFELVPFRPTADPTLPPDVDIVYLGGGYPESFAAELAANESLAAELRQRATSGLPIYAECGGFIYLGRSLTGFDGETHAMAGVLPLDFTMDREHLSIAYVTATTAADSPLGPAGTVARGQEFHQSRIRTCPADPAKPDLFELTRSDDRRSRAGLARPNIAASYVHLHLASNPTVATNFASAAGAHRSNL
jgi:cobyrinic acid a,c-diamide synthase